MTETDLVRLLLSGEGKVMAGALLWLAVALAKNTPGLEAMLRETWQKRLLAFALAWVPAVAVALMTAATWREVATTAILAFLAATGIQRLVGGSSAGASSGPGAGAAPRGGLPVGA